MTKRFSANRNLIKFNMKNSVVLLLFINFYLSIVLVGALAPTSTENAINDLQARVSKSNNLESERSYDNNNSRNNLIKDPPTLSTPSPPPPPPRSLRLPNTTFPLHYDVHLTSSIHLADLNYTANITIDIVIRQSTNEIVLHSKHLRDFLITVHNLDTGELVDDLTYSLDTVAHFLIIHPIENYQAFEAGEKYRIQILFQAKLYEKTNGIYWLTYNDANQNRTVYLAATQFEPTHARLAFPCYDEPAFKANFTIRLTHGSNYMAISNMHVLRIENHNTDESQGGQADAMTTTAFHTTPPISTYLVAFVISDFEYISETYRGITQRIFSAPGSKIRGQKALENAVQALAAFEDLFGINYPLVKLDHIALQKNYGSAMENWGLITYKDETLLYDDDENGNVDDTYKRLKDILTQTHEIAHQWFGNMVSPLFWSFAWLNEGFATYFSYIVTDMIHPQYKAMDFFLTDIAERAYSLEFLTVRPMTYYVEKESEIMGVFDIITYQRAACVLKMFHHALNQRTFVRGISYYLKEFQYGVANESQLFASLQRAVLEDTSLSSHTWANKLPEIMLSWTHSEWIPIILITRNYEDNTITIRQRSKHEHSGEHWWIPINFATKSSPDFSDTSVDYFMPPTDEVTISINDLGVRLEADDWLIANIQQTGFYHIIYDNRNLMLIAEALQENCSNIHIMNRGLIFQDLTPFIELNEIQSVNAIFELFKYLRYETELLPWNFVADTFEYFNKNLFGTPAYHMYKQFVQGLVEPMFRAIFESEPNNRYASSLSNMDGLAKQKILNIACSADLQECVHYTRRLAHEYIFDHKKIQTRGDYFAMIDSILCLGLKYLSDQEFAGILNILSTSEPRSEYYDDIIYSMRCTQSKSHLMQYLNALIGANSSHHIMNDSEAMMYLFYLYKSNIKARSVIWHFFDENSKTLSRSPHFAETFNRMAEYVPEKQRNKFVRLRESIAAEFKLNNMDPDRLLISADSPRIGKKVKMSEIFLKKFDQQIYDWLLRESSPASIQQYSASFAARNSAHRPHSQIFQAASRALRNLMKIHL